jgi:hypothetical protein
MMNIFAEPADMEHSHTNSQQKPRSEALRDAAKVVACGVMIGSGLLFPLANAEGLWFRAVVLSFFLISALSFHALHIEPFVRFGRFTAPAALTLLFVAVLAAGPSRTELIPWLPLFAVALSLITVVIHDISQHRGDDAVDKFSGVSIDTLSDRSVRTMSTQPRAPLALESNRHNSLYFTRHGPSSTVSLQTGTDGTDITLTGVVGQYGQHWDDQTRSYFPDAFLPELGHREEIHARTPIPEGNGYPDVDPVLDSDLESNHGTVASDHPLLGPQGDVFR